MLLDAAALEHGLDRVRGALGTLPGGSAWGAAGVLARAGAGPDGSSAAAGTASVALAQAPAATGRTLQGGDDVGALFWFLLVTMFFIVPCLVFLLFGFFRYLDMAFSGASSPRQWSRASATGGAAKVPSDASSSAWSAASGLCTAYVPAPGSTQPLHVLAGLPPPPPRPGSLAGKTRTNPSTGAESWHSLASPPAGGAAAAPAGPPSASFVVPVDSMTSLGDAGRVGIVDTVSGVAFSVVVSQNDQGLQRLELLTRALDTCASAEPAEGAQGGVSRLLRLRGPGGVPLGCLAPRADGAIALHRPGQPQLIIRGDEVRTEDGRLAATATRGQDGPVGAEHVELSVFDGTDVHLVVCCVFAVLLLWREGP